jgi:hypothetical protein
VRDLRRPLPLLAGGPCVVRGVSPPSAILSINSHPLQVQARVLQAHTNNDVLVSSLSIPCAAARPAAPGQGGAHRQRGQGLVQTTTCDDTLPPESHDTGAQRVTDHLKGDINKHRAGIPIAPKGDMVIEPGALIGRLGDLPHFLLTVLLNFESFLATFLRERWARL